MNILFLTPCVSIRAGGLFSSVRNLALQLAKSNNVSVYALQDSLKKYDFEQWYPIEPILFKTCPNLFKYGFSLPMLKAIYRSSADIIHVHGIRMWPSTAGRIASGRLAVPYVISPRGQLDPWIMSQNRVKKRIMHNLFENRNLRSASCIHATSEMEKRYIELLKLNNYVITVPNGVNSEECNGIGSQLARSKWGIIKERKVVLYLSNIHPKKGLEDLCAVWSGLSTKYREWLLIVAGDGSPSYVNNIQRLYESNLPRNSFIFLGDVRGSLKWSLYSCCDVFVLPTYSENFGNVIAEAMSVGKPVITTKGAPWSCLPEINAGWCTDVGVDGLSSALDAAIVLDDEVRRKMGERGRQYVKERLSWQQVADEMLACYEQLLTQV